ncbi:protein Aatf [Drosophila kikkawai]|uniref:Protein Aatf n=1 Tax=Drosophila kikkawai TaxID=30033 RepID=A0A6P4I783_DROKI|nr:protein Aatf [Drosophila kikkawai]
MLRKSKKQPQTVAEKVSQLIAHPNESDSEEDSDFDVATGPRLVDFEENEYDLPDARSTDFRKQNVKLLSEQSDRYKGKISSRNELDEEEESDQEELPYEESDEDVDLEAFNKKLSAANAKGEKESTEEDDDENEEMAQDSSNRDLVSALAEDGYDDDSEEDEDDDDDDDEAEDTDDDDDEEEAEEDAIKPSDLMSKTNHQAEIQKGLCVQNQLRIWERLLELRINTQKFTSKANQLPAPDTLKQLGSENEELQSVLNEAQERSSKLLQQLLALQSALHQQNSEMRKSVKRKHPSEEAGPPGKRFGSCLQSNFQQISSYRNEVLLKWDDRTKLLTPGAGVKRKSVQEDYDIIKKIESALGHRQVLVEKSQTMKNNQPEQPENESPKRLSHIYDDSDFYHQQLRELIEYKASTSSNMSEITKQFVELQKLRQKMKKKVDTRASKGRKLRYVVHNKLINFMAPNEVGDWTESSKSELYKSLFV